MEKHPQPRKDGADDAGAPCEDVDAPREGPHVRRVVGVRKSCVFCRRRCGAPFSEKIDGIRRQILETAHVRVVMPHQKEGVPRKVPHTQAVRLRPHCKIADARYTEKSWGDGQAGP